MFRNGAYKRKIRQHRVSTIFTILDVLIYRIIIIGSKAPGNYFASFWSDNFPILLCERPKPNISMISGFLDPQDPLFMDLNIPNSF